MYVSMYICHTSYIFHSCHICMYIYMTDVGYLGSGFVYFPLSFVQRGDQTCSKRDQDRTRRVLSNALITFPSNPRKPDKNPKYYPKVTQKMVHR